ncbi:MAG: YlmC/YmxH family sporulation protein [Chitinophagales bacterium]
MFLSELVGKEIININDGMKLGVVGDSDVVINQETGEIESIILPGRSNFINVWVERQKMVVPWGSIKKVGREVIVVDLDQTNLRLRGYSY